MKWLFLFILNLCVLVASAQIMNPDAIQDSLYRQIELFPQEKIHLHTDRNMYIPGEEIWFKVYVVDAFSHKSPTYSQYAYIELINSSDSLVYRVMVSPDDNGLFHGNIFLSEYIPEGDYTLRAYTRYMENLGDDYFFKKNIRISNLSAEAKPAKKQSNVQYDVSFFPEGGYLTEGVVCKVAFKALNRNGVSESITGEVVDKDGNILGKVNTVFTGMGSFNIIPKSGEEYFLRCKNNSGQERRFKLPAAQKTYSLASAYLNNRYFVGVKKSPELPEQPLYLLVHCKGEVLYYNSWNYNNPYITFSCDRLPSGVLQLVLFDSQMNPVSERLIFNKTEDQTKLVFSTDKSSYQKRENVFSEINVTDREGNPLTSHISVAVTDDKDIEADTLNTITSSLLLSSELKGYIESPGYYLQNNTESTLALDLLMMTHGWRIYDISKVIKGNYTYPETEFEIAKEISGLVKSYTLGRPVVNGGVLLLSNEGNAVELETDSAGRFSFHSHYPDSIRFFVQATNQKGGTRVELVLNREKFPVLKHAPKIPLQTSLVAGVNNQTTDETLDFNKKANQRAQYDEGIRSIQLPEVVITGRRGIAERDKVRLETYPFNSGSDKTIYREDFENMNIPVSLLLSAMDASITRDHKGVISIRGYGIPLILIDGVPMPRERELTVDILTTIHEVETIDIFKGPSAAVFGVRGANGAISITTRRGGDIKPVEDNFSFASFTPLGYQKPVEFYSPKYDTPESKNAWSPDFRTTIFWKPDLLISEDGKASFEFYTSDFPTTYSVVIEGLSDDGKIVRKVEKIEVR